MYIKSINLQNFRSYPEKTVEFDSGVNLILGENGAGKSNLIEAIYFWRQGKVFELAAFRK